MITYQNIPRRLVTSNFVLKLSWCFNRENPAFKWQWACEVIWLLVATYVHASSPAVFRHAKINGITSVCNLHMAELHAQSARGKLEFARVVVGHITVWDPVYIIDCITNNRGVMAVSDGSSGIVWPLAAAALDRIHSTAVFLSTAYSGTVCTIIRTGISHYWTLRT